MDNGEFIVFRVIAQHLKFLGLISDHRYLIKHASHRAEANFALKHHDGILRGLAHLGVTYDAIEVKSCAFDLGFFDFIRACIEDLNFLICCSLEVKDQKV